MLKNRRTMESHVCPWWLAFTFDNPWRKAIHNPEHMLKGLVRPGDTVADIGCGMGYFSVAMAAMVGEQGQVLAVDVQEKMLAGVARRAERAGVRSRITLHRCSRASLSLQTPLDLALAFWMAHEVPDQERLFAELAALLKTGGRLLVVEPLIHVGRRQFANTLEIIQQSGLSVIQDMGVSFSRAALFVKARK